MTDLFLALGLFLFVEILSYVIYGWYRLSSVKKMVKQRVEFELMMEANTRMREALYENIVKWEARAKEVEREWVGDEK